MQYSAEQYSAEQYDAEQCNAEQYDTMEYNKIQSKNSLTPWKNAMEYSTIQNGP